MEVCAKDQHESPRGTYEESEVQAAGLGAGGGGSRDQTKKELSVKG